MSPSHFNEDAIKDNKILKINKDSTAPMKRSSSPTSSLSSTSSSGPGPTTNGPRGGPSKAGGPHQRQPVIIYTHSPKVIHTQPQDFMTLVQKLTGLCRPEEGQDGRAPASNRPKPEPGSGNPEDSKKAVSDEADSSSVVTDENNSVNNAGDNNHVINSFFLPPPPPIFEGHPNPYMTGFPMFNPNGSTDFLRSNQPSFYSNYGDRLFFGSNVRTTFSSPQTFDMMMNEFPEF